MFCSLSDSPSVEECVSGERVFLHLPFFCFNYEEWGFNLQEENDVLHFNSMRILAEADLGAMLNCCPWLRGLQGNTRPTEAGGLALLRCGAEETHCCLNYGKVYVPLKPAVLQRSGLALPHAAAWGTLAKKPLRTCTLQPSKVGMDTGLGQHRRHQSGNFCICN